jgi:ribokinase
MVGKVVVVGSLNMDLVVQVPRRPVKGETLRGTGFSMFVGGKGNNQAIAAARAGASVSMVGRVGQDAFGEVLLTTLAKNGIEAGYVQRDAEVGTGIANITVDAEGDNSIVLAPQANDRLSPQDVAQAAPVFEAAQVLLLQLEVPLETVSAAAQLARRAGVLVVLNPAPAPASGTLPSELLQALDLFIPNQTETEGLTGLKVSDEASAIAAARALQALGPKNIIITLGEQGALLLQADGSSRLIPAYSVNAIDTTAAGDAFCGALAAWLASGTALPEAIGFACAAGALAATRLGAEPSLPYRPEIIQLAQSR